MRLAFVLFTWFPHGGLQQDLVKVVKACQQRAPGNSISIFCQAWNGERLDGVDTVIVPANGWTAIARRAAFAAWIAANVQGKFDTVIGFNRIPGLDYYYAADLCFAAKARGERGVWYRLLPRTRQYLRFEQAVFGSGANTVSLLLSPVQRVQYKQYYATPDARLLDLPPGIKREHCAGPDAAELRRAFRAEHGIGDDELVVLQVGSSFRIKGVARSLTALASLPPALKKRVRYFLVGRDAPKPWLQRAAAVGLRDQVNIVGALGGIPRFMQGADVLLHPSIAESAGMVLLEAIVAGLPVLTTASCGYAFHVEQAQAGCVCPEPFSQDMLNSALASMLQADRSAWRANGIRYGQAHNLYDMPQTVANLILDGAQLMSAELWLREDFKQLWEGQDPFAAAFAIEGETFRALEQRQTLAFSANGKRYFIKRHKGATWKEILKNLLSLRLPVVSARNEYRAIRKLRQLGLSAPVPVAYGSRGLLPASLESFLVTEDVGAHASLEDYCRPWNAQRPSFAEKRALIEELADISHVLHTNGVCHRDYYLCHFLRTGTDAPLVVIDLHRALVKERLSERWIVKDLAGLYFSAMDAGLTRHDLFRFMRSYRQSSLRETLVRDKEFWRQVSERALRLYRKEHGR